jgi:hypothetical protein
VAGDAEGFEVVPIVGEAFHLLECLRRFHGHPVMHVDGWGDVAFGHSCSLALADAPLAEGMLAEVGDAEFSPSAVVEKSLVSWVSAHGCMVYLNVIYISLPPSTGGSP